MKTLKQLREAARTPERAAQLVDRLHKMKKFRARDASKEYPDIDPKLSPSIKTLTGKAEKWRGKPPEFSKAQTQDIDIKSIRTNQRSVSTHLVKNHIADANPKPLNVVRRIDKSGQVYHHVVDGNHRVAAARALGKKTITARVIDKQTRRKHGAS